jgi:hypothetical protein
MNPDTHITHTHTHTHTHSRHCQSSPSNSTTFTNDSSRIKGEGVEPRSGQHQKNEFSHR